MAEPISPFGVFPSAAPRGTTDSSPLMPPRPADIDAASLTAASGSQLDFWIQSANRNAGKKLLVKTGKVDVRRQRLADYYGIDLANIPIPATVGPSTRDKEINLRQWAHLRALGTEWATQDSAGRPFQLISDDPGQHTRRRMSTYQVNFRCSHWEQKTYCRVLNLQLMRLLQGRLKGLHPTL